MISGVFDFKRFVFAEDDFIHDGAVRSGAGDGYVSGGDFKAGDAEVFACAARTVVDVNGKVNVFQIVLSQTTGTFQVECTRSPCQFFCYRVKTVGRVYVSSQPEVNGALGIFSKENICKKSKFFCHIFLFPFKGRGMSKNDTFLCRFTKSASA